MAGVKKFNAKAQSEQLIADIQTIPKYADISGHSRRMILNDLVRAKQYYDDDLGFYVYDIHHAILTNIRKGYIFEEKDLFDEDWYQECEDYIDNLSKREKYIIKTYTRHGDVIVNALLRNPAEFPNNKRVQDLIFHIMPDSGALLYAMQLIDIFSPGNEDSFFSYYTTEIQNDEDNNKFKELTNYELDYLGDTDLNNDAAVIEKFTPLIYKYIDELRAIIKNAPPLTYPIQVLRASDTDYLNTPYATQTVKGFLSTSFSTHVIEKFNYNRYIYEITLHPGTPCLSIKSVSRFYEEFEVLVDTESWAMPSDLVEKHFLQTNTKDDDFEPRHIFESPLNEVKLVRHIQLMSTKGAGSATKGGRAMTMRRSVATHRKRSKTRSTSVRKTAMKSLRKTRSKKVTVSQRYVKSARSARKTMKPWQDRDHLPPLVVNEPVPPHIQEMLLNAHKKAGTYFKESSVRRSIRH